MHLSNFVSASLDGNNNKITSRKDLEKYRQELIATFDPRALRVLVCCGTGCKAVGSEKVFDALKVAVKELDVADDIKVVPLIKRTGCHGFCSRGPLLTIEPEGIFYQSVKPDDSLEIVKKTLIEGELIKKLLYKAYNSKEMVTKVRDIPFFNKQTKIVLQRVGKIDPFDIKDALINGAYRGLSKCLGSMTPREVIDEIVLSKLRGRGGAGFPTGFKWESCSKILGERYIICNGDEGDPGAFMDASIMEGDPHAVLEGMAIAAYAIGSNRGFIYVRMEYPLAVRTLNVAINQAKTIGLLGDNIMGSGFSFKVTISTGAGAFVCGESSALMSSLEGKVGRPRAKYIRSVEKGFRDSPSNLNNVETYANIPEIILRGGEWFKSYGTDQSTGTKVFSLTGNVYNVGLVEVPMGFSLSELIFDIGGGVPNKRELKGVQTGGPSGSCIPIPSKVLDISVSYDTLVEVGSMMGSGGMIVMDEDTCMVEVARYFVNFLVEESCGQCSPCREGLVRMLEILTRITTGEAKDSDLNLLQELGIFINKFSLCGLGQSAANPVLGSIRWYPEEYEAHIKYKRCPAGVCKALYHYEIQNEICNGCGYCKLKCPAQAISGEKRKVHNINQKICVKCMECYKGCKFRAIKVI